MKKKLKSKLKHENSSLVASVLDIIPVKAIETRKEMTELKVSEFSPTKKGKEYYLFLGHNNHDLTEGDLCVFDVDFREPVYDFGSRKHYDIKGYYKIKKQY